MNLFIETREPVARTLDQIPLRKHWDLVQESATTRVGAIMSRTAGATAIAVFSLGLSSGCMTTPTQQGAVMGGVLGAGTGAIVGHQSGHKDEGAWIGAAVGALAGALAGDQVGQYRSARSRNNQPGTPQQPPATAAGKTPSKTQPASPEKTPQAKGHWEQKTVTSANGETKTKNVWIPSN